MTQADGAISWSRRSLGRASLVALAVLVLGTLAGQGEPWPLGGASSWTLPRVCSLALALGIGWGWPGLSLALLWTPAARGPALLARAFATGTLYLIGASLAYALMFGHAPGQLPLLVLLAVPSTVAALRPEAGPRTGQPDRAPLWLILILAALTAGLWPRLAGEGLNGDGIEAYELSRSLQQHRLPRWDMERDASPGRFGLPANVPLLSQAYVVSAQMTVLGNGEIGVRLPFLQALVLGGAAILVLVPRRGASAAAYLAALGIVYVLWNAYFVGYEPPYTDLAEPAGIDTFTAALWLCGYLELTAGVGPIGMLTLLAASANQYSGPILTTLAGAVLWLLGGRDWRRPALAWLAAVALGGIALLALGLATGDLSDWVREFRVGYWQDLADASRRVPAGPLGLRLLLLTGGLVVVALARVRRLPLPAQALLATAVLYALPVLAGSYKNLHYLTPFPFLIGPAVLAACGPGWRLLGTAVLAAVAVTSWPGSLAIHAENRELGRRSCVAAADYEDAVLGSSVVYDAFDEPGRGERFEVGKQTFVRYGLALGGPGCVMRLGPGEAPGGWVTAAERDGWSFAVRDVDVYARWRLHHEPVPSSLLFRRPAPAALPVEAERWSGRFWPERPESRALLVSGFSPAGRSAPPFAWLEARARVLVPVATPGGGVRLRLHAGAPETVGLVVNGAPAGETRVGPGPSEVSTAALPWAPGWNLLELRSPVPQRVGLEWLEVGRNALQ